MHGNSLTAQKNLYALVDFSKFINSSLDLEFISNNLLLTCFGKFHCTKGVVIIFNEDYSIKTSFSKGIVNFDKSLANIKYANQIEISYEFKKLQLHEHLNIKKDIIASENKIGVIFLGKKLSKQDFTDEDHSLLSTLLNITSISIQNSLSYNKLKELNKELDTKINQLSSIFDIGKEFSSILELERVSKLLVFSILGQLLVTKYALILYDNHDIKILDSKFDNNVLKSGLANLEKVDFTEPLRKTDIENSLSDLTNLGIELIIPMKIKTSLKGLILLGARPNKIPFSNSDIDFISSIASFAVISIENSRLFTEALEKQKLEKDLEIARSIQQNLLPSSMPKQTDFEIAAYNKSAKQIGGDYYDIIPISKTKTLIAIADVSGKGVQAALLMANLQAFLKSIARQNLKLDEASNLINDLVSENTTNGSFITFFWGIIDVELMQFTYVNMGHNPPLVLSENELTKLTVGGMILGVMKTVFPYQSECIKLHNNDFLILFTDGITEAMNISNEEYSDEKLEKLILSKKNVSAADKMLNSILKDVSNYTNEAVQSDDLTLMVVRIK